MRDFEYGVVPDEPLDVQQCVACDTEFLFPRPTAADLVDFYPSDYHAFNDDHGRVAGTLVRLRAKRRAHAYEQMLGGRKGRLFDVGTGDCRHFDELREELDIEYAGVELHPEVAAAGRARGYDVVVGTLEEMDLTGHEGRYDIVSMNHVLEHVRRAGRGGGAGPAAAASRGPPARPAADQQLVGGPGLRSSLGRLPLPPAPADVLPGRARAAPRTAGFTDISLRTAPHIQTAISLQNTVNSWGWDPPKHFGKVRGYGALLGVVAPFELAAYAADRGGIIDFHAVAPG